MAAVSDTRRATLQRDLTEALLRLKLARSARDRKEERAFEKRLDWLLDRLCRELGMGDER